MDRPRILIIENSVDVTGALKSIIRVASDLKDHFNFLVLIPKNSKGRAWVERNGFHSVEELPMKEISKRLNSLLLYLPYLFMNAFRLNKIVKKNSITLIHVNDLYNLLPVVIRFFGNDTPYVCHIRFLPDRFPPWLFNFWLRLHLKYAKKVVAVSKSVLKQLPHHPKLVLIYNELPAEERYPDLLNPGPNKPSYTFLYLANFIRGKGQNFAIEAFAKIHNELPNWKLRFVGGDMGLEKNRAFRSSLELRAKELNILKKIEWKGFTEDVELEYKQADVILNFSESESFSITCLEALYFGRPVIATDCGGPSEVVDHNQTGFLVPNRDVNEMAQAMLKLATNPDRVKEMGTQAAIHVREKFSIEKTSFRMKQIFDEALSH